MNARYASLEEVIQEPVFPAVDIALRRGRHIDRDDGDWYAFIVDAQEHLERFYRRYGCELVTQTEGYFYLLPTGNQLIRRHLTAGEMLVGQTLALQYLDPATVESGGVVGREQLLARLVGLLGERELAKALDPRRRRFEDERVVHDLIRSQVAKALRRLADLGFVELLDQERLRLRAPLLRFADPVRGLTDMRAAMARLITKGEVVSLSAEDDEMKPSADASGEQADQAEVVAAGEPDEDDENAEDGDVEEGEA
jgi:chromosome partition protein MukE